MIEMNRYRGLTRSTSVKAWDLLQCINSPLFCLQFIQSLTPIREYSYKGVHIWIVLKEKTSSKSQCCLEEKSVSLLKSANMLAFTSFVPWPIFTLESNKAFAVESKSGDSKAQDKSTRHLQYSSSWLKQFTSKKQKIPENRHLKHEIAYASGTHFLMED